MKRATIPNPSLRGGLVKVQILNPAEITDRAKRYRAQSAIAQPDRRCVYCGTRRGRLDVEHINGDESDSRSRNLAYACRSCNTRKGVVFRKAGFGKRTRQFNPRGGSAGARSLGQWIQAVLTVKGQGGSMSLPAAVELIRATPPARRSEFAAEIWRRRKERSSEVPF